VNLNKNNRIVLWLSLLVTLALAGLVVSGQTQDPNPVTETVSLLQKLDGLSQPLPQGQESHA